MENKVNIVNIKTNKKIQLQQEKVAVSFLKWFLDGNNEDYYAGIKTIEELFKKFKNEQSRKNNM